MPSSAPFPNMPPPGYSSMQATQGMHSAYLAAIEQRHMSGHTASRPSPESPSSETTPSPCISRLNIRASSSEASPTPSTPSSVHGPNPTPPGHVDLPPPGHADRIKRIHIIAEGEGFYPSRPTANAISAAIRQVYNGAYPTWGSIPHSQQQAMLNEFMVLGHPPPCKMRTLRRCGEQFNNFLGIVRMSEKKESMKTRSETHLGMTSESLKAQVNHLIGLPRSPPKSHIYEEDESDGNNTNDEEDEGEPEDE
ncbi:hypothetical protein A4A49_37258 [Nicotiana attenuata]|uniref:Uncharacterized protein n=1 Tax=Nicotiana attenuata TaxID=49451 RepID=A0A1J6KN36_NICAT|nr:hypothetical protein A4A49_37258 [Nicotiana attenuata]